MIFAATTILIRVFLSLGALVTAGGALLIDSRAAKDLGTLIDIDRSVGPVTSDTTAAQISHDAVIDSVDLLDISYTYDTRRDVLRELSLTFRRGRTYSLIGPSGTGKSTLADILLGLVTPSGGEIRINGEPVRPADLRKRVIVVEQQPRIFSVSVRENLTLGLSAYVGERRDRSSRCGRDDLIRERATRRARDHARLPGRQLSGGQRQRLSIARALLRRPEILILDEATSALDAATEEIVIRSVKRAMRDGILILITHDPELAAESPTTSLTSGRGLPNWPAVPRDHGRYRFHRPIDLGTGRRSSPMHDPDHLRRTVASLTGQPPSRGDASDCLLRRAAAASRHAPEANTEFASTSPPSPVSLPDHPFYRE